MRLSSPKINRNRYTDRDSFQVPTSDSYTSRVAKVQGYETRMYYQTLDCFNHQGKAFNTTLTYNDSALTQYYGYNVPNHDDLRWLTHDSTFLDRLRSKYGVGEVKYFIGTELGEGKGSRGYHNNPHYHCIWFCYPKPGQEKLFSRLNGETFSRLIKLYWQGVEYKVNGSYYSKDELDKMNLPNYNKILSMPHLKQYKRCDYGIVSSGRYGYEITDRFGMNTYVCKYAAKDIVAIDRENSIFHAAYDYWFSYLTEQKKLLEYATIFSDGDTVEAITSKYGDGLNDIPGLADRMARKDREFYRVHYSTRVKCSEGLGITAMDAITDKMNPTIPYTTKDGFEARNVPQYIFRKVYRYQDKETRSYLKNDLGRDLEICQIKKNEVRLLNKVVEYYKFFKAADINKYLSRLNGHISVFDEEYTKFFVDELDAHINNVYDNNVEWYDNLFKKYAVFKTYYDGLCFNPDYGYTLCPMDDWMFNLSLQERPSIKETECISYSALPIFDKDIWLFNILDDIIEVRNKILDIQNKEKKAEQDRLRKSLLDQGEFANWDYMFEECAATFAA